MIVRQRYTQPRSFDRTFDQLTRSFFETAARPSGPTFNGSWVDDEYVLTLDLPGVPAEAVKVDVVGEFLQVTVKSDSASDSVDFERKLRLNAKLDGNKVSARHVDGRLTVRIGQVDAPEARSIEIDTTAAAPALEVNGDEVADTES